VVGRFGGHRRLVLQTAGHRLEGLPCDSTKGGRAFPAASTNRPGASPLARRCGIRWCRRIVVARGNRNRRRKQSPGDHVSTTSPKPRRILENSGEHQRTMEHP
jgi:hypothetical protein